MLWEGKSYPRQVRLLEEEEVDEGEVPHINGEISKRRTRRFGRWCGYREVRRCKFGWFCMVYMDCTPGKSIFIHHLRRVRDSLDPKAALPARSRFIGTFWRGGHHENESPLLVRVGRGGWRWSGESLSGAAGGPPRNQQGCRWREKHGHRVGCLGEG